jgi:hypothetical protein
MISSAHAQDVPAAAKAPLPKAAPAAAKAVSPLDAAIQAKEQEIASLQAPQPAPAQWWSTTSAMTMSATVLLFGFLTLCLAAYVIRRGHPWEAVLKIFGMVLIIVLTVFLIVAGYDDKQIAPAMGLLGTIAGYLLGKDVARPDAGQARAPGTGQGTPGPLPPAKPV